MQTSFRIVTVCATLAALTSCATQPEAPLPVTGEPVDATSACIDSLGGDGIARLGLLDSDNINVVNWNIQKRRNTAWAGELADQMLGPDLLILQETIEANDAWQDIAPDHFVSFAEGFGPDTAPSGVMTISAAQPLTECRLVALEPWFGTRKATLITEYGLTETDETLLVVNIHGINFALGVQDLANQFAQATAVIEAHDGPVLFSGDFNTWRGERQRVLEAMLNSLGLDALDYDVDHRKRFFGSPLDHIYVRGLTTEHATTMKSTSSDHNPMSVRLRVADGSPVVSAPR